MNRNIFVIALIAALMANVETSILIEDDILVEPDYFSSKLDSQRPKRAAIAKKERIWDFGVVPYVVDATFTGDEQAGFKKAMKHWENNTCIKFVERNASEHENYIRFTELPCGCCSKVGKQGNGSQDVSIGKNCHKIGVIVHELGHAIGFWHEHTRPDRDNYVSILSENILAGHEHNFDKQSVTNVDSLGQPYDYGSIMHYSRIIYSKNEYDATILPKRGKGRRTPKIGQRERLSRGDIIQANMLYKCAKCGRTFLEPHASFASPNYNASSNSGKRYECEWRISVTNGEQIRLKIFDLDMLESTDCTSDYLEIRDGYWHKSALLGRFCGTRIDRPAILSTGSRMVLKYVSQHPNNQGFAASYEAICGGHLNIINGNRIESPNYPQFYLPNKECIWRLSTATNSQVAIEFSTFDLEPHINCRRDFVEVRDGDSFKSRLIGKYCGNSLPPILASTTNKMFIRFSSDASAQGRGFSATLYQEINECKLAEHGCEQNCINTLDGYTCTCRLGYKLRSDMKTCEINCGGVISTTNGTIESPSFPHAYPANEECVWEIVSHDPYRIVLNFTHFELEGSQLVQEECDYDSVRIASKYPDGRMEQQAVYCSNILPPSITSETSIMRITFKSDNVVQKSGFSAIFSTLIDRCAIKNGGCEQKCRSTIDSVECSCKTGFILHENGRNCVPSGCRYEIATPEGVIRSPNYPTNYSKNTNCVWHFKAIHGHRPIVKFQKFDIEGDYECSNDFVSVYITVDTLKRFFTNTETFTLGKFCGSNLPTPISSPSDDMYMAFKTDNSVQRRGFILKHSTVCGGHFIASTTTKYIYSHARYGDTFYEHHTSCDWIILVKQPGQRIHLAFQEFDVESEKACSFDYVDLYEERDRRQWILYGRFCGNLLNVEVVTSRRLLLRFRSDETVRRKGFRVSYAIANSTLIRDYESGSSRFTRLSSTSNDYIMEEF